MATVQVALALGVPWGAFAHGGRAARDDGSRPPGDCAASVATSFVLAFFSRVMLLRGGDIGTSGEGTGSRGFLFDGITLVLAVLCAVVAASGPS